jgi:hypothetical protein
VYRLLSDEISIRQEASKICPLANNLDPALFPVRPTIDFDEFSPPDTAAIIALVRAKGDVPGELFRGLILGGGEEL